MRVRVGELAKRCGVSVRTLHHYDEIGLVSPSERSESGHRLYVDEDVQRLQKVISLRSLGFSLEQIDEFLGAQSDSLLQILDMHLEKLQREAEERQKLIDQLEKLTGAVRTGQSPTVDEFLDLIEGMTMFEKYYSPEQMDKLQERKILLGEDKIHRVENDWVTLIAEVRVEMATGANPACKRVQLLAQRWQDLLGLFTGGDMAIADSGRKMYKEEGASKASRGTFDDSVFEYMKEAIAAMKQN